MKVYSPLSNVLEFEPQYQMLFRVISGHSKSGFLKAIDSQLAPSCTFKIFIAERLFATRAIWRIQLRQSQRDKGLTWTAD